MIKNIAMKEVTGNPGRAQPWCTLIEINQWKLDNGKLWKHTQSPGMYEGCNEYKNGEGTVINDTYSVYYLQSRQFILMKARLIANQTIGNFLSRNN